MFVSRFAVAAAHSNKRQTRFIGSDDCILGPSDQPPRKYEKSRGTMMGVDDSKRRLMWHGMLLFLLGLLTGLVEQHFSNPRMGLAAHLQKPKAAHRGQLQLHW